MFMETATSFALARRWKPISRRRNRVIARGTRPTPPVRLNCCRPSLCLTPREAADPQASREGRRLPMAVRNRGKTALSFRSPSVVARHLGGGARLVDEDQPRRIKFELGLWPCMLASSMQFELDKILIRESPSIQSDRRIRSYTYMANAVQKITLRASPRQMSSTSRPTCT
jgi:hypothetical protein